MKKILVTGAGGSAAYNFIKSLRQTPEKVKIIGTDSQKFHLPLSGADKKYVLPPATDKNYIDELNSVIEKEKVEFIHPQPDIEVSVISENRDSLRAKTLLPEKKTIRVCQDKMLLNSVLRSRGIPVPESRLIKNREDLSYLYKIMIPKHNKLWLRAIKGAGSRASLPIAKLSHANFWIDYWKTNKGIGFGNFMLSEYLPGKEFAFQSLWMNGRLVTSQARERIEYVFGNLTPSGQSSSPSVARTVSRNDVNKIATSAVLAVDPLATGIFCVDLKENRSGIPCVTEINAGRFFTTSFFFTSAGLNMPFLYIKLGFGENIVKVKKYNPLPSNLYWIRMIDMGYKVIKDASWGIELK